MRCAVAIFAKTIGLSGVKTRLAKDIGTAKAEEFYSLSVNCVESFVSEAGEAFPETIYPVWCVAEEDGPPHWRERSYPSIWTGEGGLGTRLATVSEHLFETYDAVMLMGTDSPHLHGSILLQAIAQLNANPQGVVVGPADDGGFYLFASTHPVPREIWEAVTYSASTTLDEFEAKLGEISMPIHHLNSEQDVDTVADLKQLKESLVGTERQLTAAQSHLSQWLASNET